MPRPHSATMSCRLSSTIISATPNAYWRTCSMCCNHTADQVGRHAMQLVVLPCAWSGPSHPLDQRSGCCKGLPSNAAFVENTNAQKKLPPSHLRSLSHTQGRCHGEKKPAAQRMHEGTRKSNAIHVAPKDRAMRTAQKRPQQEERGESNYTVVSFASLFPDGLVSHTHK
ncbi:unspecified product [Trypanosoma cruzi Dm28c]|uniref:Unspecified product n=1 Tax=Trypanosoma cruzi Dm28c TaxID=1416333 RepID=V5AJJ7_TRYCR|nr:unspecified product [Trypanosoma cruzi Dm28c]